MSDQIEFGWASAEETHTSVKLRDVRRAPQAAVARRVPGRRPGDNDPDWARHLRGLSKAARDAYELLDDVPRKTRELTAHGVNPLYALQRHGLARKTPAGWVRS